LKISTIREAAARGAGWRNPLPLDFACTLASIPWSCGDRDDPERLLRAGRRELLLARRLSL